MPEHSVRLETGQLQIESPGNGMTRRDAAKTLGAGILFLFTVAGARADEKLPLLSSRLHVGEDGEITLLTGKIECGQGIRTSLTQVAAEELRVKPSQVRLIMGDTALVPDDGGTWGSLTTPQTAPVIRQACASMRELLQRCAAEKWKVEPATLQVIDGGVRNADGRTFTYKDLAKNGSLATAVNLEAPLVKPSQWKICGTPLHTVDGVALVSGAYRYSSDLKAAGMWHGRIVRPPNYRCKLLSFDASKLDDTLGAKVIHDGDFLGVIAPTTHAADAAAQSVHAQWSDDSLGDPETLFASLKATAKPPDTKGAGRYPAFIQEGSVADGLAHSDRQLKASYQIAYIAHVPLESRAAIAEWKGDHLTVRCGTQAPFPVRDEIAQAFGIPAEHVRIIVSDTGSGYGGKHGSECELAAARLARSAPGPVRLGWSREEEFTSSYCRPAAVMDVQSGVQADGKIVAWEFHNYNGGAASLPPPYRIPNRHIAYHESESPLRQGSYRSLAAVGNTFARETHIEEMAAALRMDPLEFRLRNVDNPRLQTVLHRAAERFGWGKSKSGNSVGYGLACNVEKGGHLALFTELETDGKQVRLKRMVAAFDAGAVINPDILSNQVEGAIVQGIGGALFEELKFDKKRITNPKLSAYRVPRFPDVPDIEVILVDRRDLPSAGAGESPITVAAPSIGAALYAACGKRIRALPMLPALAIALTKET